LIGWSPQGCTATTRQASKFFTPLSIEELVELHVKFGEHYAYWHQYAEPDLDSELDDDGEITNDDCSENVMAVEEMHDALRARSLIGYEITLRAEKAKAAASVRKTTAKKLRAV
jgi:hypothetical protein